MSCISALLKIKGEKEFMVCKPKNQSPTILLSGGIYKNYEFCVTLTDIGFRCGYVAIPKNNYLYNRNINDLPELECHGGVTYFDYPDRIIDFDFLKIKRTCKDIWIGFDAAHAGDAKDIKALSKIYKKDKSYFELKYYSDYHSYTTVKDTEYMINSCYSLINSIIEEEGELI